MPGRAQPEAGAAERLRTLVADQFDQVWRLLRRLGVPGGLVEDAVQEVFAVVARRLAEVEPGSEKSYVYGTALRVAQGVRRRCAIEVSRYRPIDGQETVSEASPEDLVAQRRELRWLDQVLESLDAPERAVFVLFEFEGFTLTEMASLLEIPRGTVASRLRRAREEFFTESRRLRARLRGKAREP
jgi:RNA polymerase sigma-70 factor (ECF subfamily)